MELEFDTSIDVLSLPKEDREELKALKIKATNLLKYGKALHNMGRTRAVLEMRWKHDMTLEEVGMALGVTRERVRQIESMAFRKIRNDPVLRKMVRDAIDDMDDKSTIGDNHY
jgi:DNA-directed RNA polymerase sigma subunit (sigma70/sigma32)